MPKRLLFPMLSLLAGLWFSVTYAQEQTLEPITSENSGEAWGSIERCIGEANPSPDDWTFGGTLLLSGSRVYRQEWETPRILEFYTTDIPFGKLSPDGRWFAYIQGKRTEIGMYAEYRTESINVYSTIDDNEQFSIEWKNTYTPGHRLYGHRLHWLDSQHLIYSLGNEIDQEWFIINPFTGDVIEWDRPFSPTQFAFELSPDGEKALYTDWGFFYWFLHNGQEEIEVPVWLGVVWHSNSSGFAAYTVQPDLYVPEHFALFDLEGNITDIIFAVSPQAEVVLEMGNVWSSDGRYLLFAIDRLYLADTRDKVVIDTCIPTRSLTVAWSPSSTQFAMIDPVYSDREIQIVDLSDWSRYVVGYHSGSVIGWRLEE